jgi:Flp pilus assembly protein TadG
MKRFPAFFRKAGALSRSSRGQSSVELVMVLPVLMLVAAAVCQLALGLNCYLVIGSASREGARRAAETNDVSAASEAAMKSCGGLSGAKPRVDVDFPEGRSRGRPVRVTVSYRMPLLIPGLDSLVPSPDLKRSTAMALEKSN